MVYSFFNKVELGTLGGPFQKLNVSLLYPCVFRITATDQAEETGGNPTPVLFHPLCAIHDYHWQQNSPRE